MSGWRPSRAKTSSSSTLPAVPAVAAPRERARAAAGAARSGARARRRQEELRDGEIRVPARLQWRLEEAIPTRGATRGFLGDVLFSDRHRHGPRRGQGGRFRRIEGRRAVRFPGDGRLQADADQLTRLTGAVARRAADGPVARADSRHLLGDQRHVRQAVDRASATGADPLQGYGGRVYGLDHPTLGASPIANAITLAEAVPAGARLHLLTHSRGGLVAEVLAASRRPADTFAPFTPKPHAEQREELRALAKLVRTSTSRSSASSAWPAPRAERCWPRSGSMPTSRW